MSKNRAIYKGYTAMELKTRSNIPAAADITVNASDIDCDNIATYDVRSVLGETTYDLEELCISVLTNMYSQFRNGWWILETGILVAKFPIQNFELDEWAGYNHSAPAPSKNNYNTGVSYPSGGSPTIYVTMEVGEIDWTDALIAGINGAEFEVKQGAAIKGTHLLSYTDSRHQNGFNFTTTFSTSIFTNFTVRFYFTKDGVEVCPVPNLSSYTVTATELIPTYIGTIDMDAALQAAIGGVVVYTLASLNTTTDKYTMLTLAVDTDGDGDGDVNRFNMDLWARKNYGAWSQVQDNKFMNGVNGFSITDDDLPWAIGVYGDRVDFELRDGL